MGAHREFGIVTERNKIVAYLAANPTEAYRAVTAVARSVVLNSPYQYNGSFFEVKAKSLGAGVYELTIKPEKRL